jgi:hypothetical protein
MDLTKQIRAIRLLQKLQAEALATLGNSIEINPTIGFIQTELDRLIAQIQAAIIEGSIQLKMVVFLFDQTPISERKE